MQGLRHYHVHYSVQNKGHIWFGIFMLETMLQRNALKVFVQIDEDQIVC